MLQYCVGYVNRSINNSAVECILYTKLIPAIYIRLGYLKADLNWHYKVKPT